MRISLETIARLSIRMHRSGSRSMRNSASLEGWVDGVRPWPGKYQNLLLAWAASTGHKDGTENLLYDMQHKAASLQRRVI